MKIIDILVKKANGILEDGFMFRHENYTYTYSSEDGKIKDVFHNRLSYNVKLEEQLNDEVEVIEENKEIEELKMLIADEAYSEEDIYENRLKINELVRAVNKLTSKGE